MAILYSRLESKAMGKGNFKARCVNNDLNPGLHTVGKIYEFKNGIYKDDCGFENGPFETYEKFIRHTRSDFELLEDPVTVVDILNKCTQLQEKGHKVTFTSRGGEIEVEHRHSEDFHLIAGFSTYESGNGLVLKTIINYLDGISETEGK